MNVLHAIWDTTAPGILHLWGESSELAVVPTNQPGEKPSRGQNKTHPFALSQSVLRGEVARLLRREELLDGQVERVGLDLPTSSGGPLPSPDLLLDRSVKAAQKRTLKRWTVESWDLAPSAALDFLLELPVELPQGVAFGDSLRFWTEAARFAFELLTRQCFVPALTIDQSDGASTGYAHWIALLSAEDNRRVHTLARAMPPVCWVSLPAGQKSAAHPYELLVAFLNQTIDGLVRAQIPATQLVPEEKRVGQKKGGNFAARWLRALSSPVGVFALSASDMAAALETQKWLEQVQVESSQAPFRTCFKLDPPGEEQTEPDTWRVSFHLQANDDHSLLIPAEKAWQERSESLTFLSRKFEQPQERLLADLGRAARLFPLIEQSLQTAHPQELLLNTEQAYAFLRETAPLLESSGFGVLVPPWWQKASARVGIKLSLKPQAASGASLGLLGFEKIVNYDWNIAIGDQTLSMREFEQLVDLKLPLVKVRGQWVELRADQIEAAIAFFKKKYAKQSVSLAEALRDTLGEDMHIAGLPITEIEAEGWIRDALDRLTQRVPLNPIEPPAAFHGKLRPYQIRGVSWLVFLKQLGFGSCLADDMGLGKTIQLITLLLHEIEQAGSQPEPTLLICPMSIVGNWQREIQRFAPSLSVMIHHGMERLSGPAFAEAAQQYNVIITTYAMALRDREHLALVDWRNVVIDEAQNIKNESAKQTQAIKSLKAVAKIALTGTPVENRLAELWSIMDFLNPGYLGTGTDFRKTFANPIERYHNAEQSALLKRLIQPFVLRRLKTDKEIIQDLPDKMEMNVFCNLTQEQASLYEAVLKEMLEKIEETVGMARRGLILATLTRLKQICNHPAQFMGDGSQLAQRSGKLARLEEMLEEVLSGGEKALVFTQYAEMGGLLRQYLQERLGVEVLFLHGAIVKKQRDLLVQRFQEERRGAAIFILSLKAGGVGLNLTAANHVFHFDRWWNPAVENQATDRAFRIGQRRNVQVHKFVCVGTLEERIDQMIEQKRDLAERIVGEGENWLTEMSTDQLKELFALSREAVGE